MAGRTRSRGFLLLPVALLLVLVAALAFMVNRSGPVAAQLAGGEREAAAARMAAEAGLQHALWRANRNSCSGYDLASTAFGQHSYQVSFTPASGSPVFVAATGNTAGGASATLRRSGVKVYDGVTTTVLQPDAAAGKDTWLYEWKPLWNYGAAATLTVTNRFALSAGNALLEFDLSAIPAGATVLTATLELYQNNAATMGGTVGVRRVTSEWNEGTANGATGAPNWTQRTSLLPWLTPGGDRAADDYGTASGAAGVQQWYRWDVSRLVGEWLSGTTNRGLALVPVTSNTDVYFSSSDATNAAQRPKLTVTYLGCECGGGTTGSTVLTPGVGGEDTYIDDDKNLENYGADAVIRLTNKPGSQKRGLLRFDLSWLPPAATVTSATLSMNLEDIGSANSGTASVHRLTRSWKEGDGTTTGGCYKGASWNRYDTCSAWATAGGEFDATPAATAAIDWATPGVRSWNLTPLVAGMHDGTYPNHGFLLQASDGINHADFTTGDAADANLHPKLTIGFSCPCGADCTPGPPPVFDYLDTLPLACNATGAASASAGSEDWSPWAWSEINDDTNWCGGGVRIEPDLGGHSFQLKQHDRGLQREMDLSSFPAAWLTFGYRFVDVASGNSLRVRVSSDGGAGWTELAPIAGPGDHASYQVAVYDIAAYRTANTRIAFLPSLPVTTGAPTNQVFIDNVQVTSKEPPPGPSTLTLSANADATIYQGAPLANYGSSVQLTAGNGDNLYYRALVRFDLSALPAGATVASAKLRLYLEGGAGADVDVDVYRVGSAWSEGLVTWLSSAGGGATGSSYGSVRVYPGTPGWVEWIIPETLVHEWKDGVTPNHGLILTSASKKFRWGNFASRENATAANRPQLVLTYTE